MAGPIPSLVLARLRRRGATALISMAAVGAAAALIAIVSGIGLIAAREVLQRLLRAVLDDLEIVRGEIGDEVAPAIGHRDAGRHELRFGAERRLLGRGERERAENADDDQHGPSHVGW